jgi:serine/threonine protein phosphatase PrpC
MTDCRNCSAPIDPAHRFCESCGAVQAEVSQVAVPRPGRAADQPCPGCGNTEHADDYCTQCGQRRPEPDRDELALGEVYLVTDRGIHHASNEDAAAAGSIARDEGTSVAAVVCDGVSSARDSASASTSASQAAVTAILAALSSGRPAEAAMVAGLTEAAKAARAAFTDQPTAPSCTFTGAVVVPAADGAVDVTVGNVGDSRTYWLPLAPNEAQQLTLDDSLARELIAAGVAADSEAVLRGEHTLTRWLGADADAQPWAEGSVKTVTVRGPGTVLVCSDGLWNYLPDAADLAARCAGADAVTAARALVDFANQSGGQDNITVVLVPIGG